MFLAWKKFHRFDGLDLMVQRVGLGALAQRLREREEQRDDRDQQRHPLVKAQVDVDVAAAAVAVFVMLDLVLDFVLNRMNAVTYGRSLRDLLITRFNGGSLQKSDVTAVAPAGVNFFF